MSASVERVPQTYFLEDAVTLARNSLFARLDSTLGYQPFFRLDLGPEGPRAVHASWDYCDMAGRFVDALALTAPMVGAGAPSEAEEGLRAFLLNRANPRDGLCYDAEAPWSVYHADMFCQGRALIGLVTLYLQTGSSDAEAKIDGMVAGLSRIAIWDGDRASYPKDIWIEDHWEDGGLWNGNTPGYSAQQIVGLARYAKATGNQAALRLARGLTLSFQASGVIAPDGTFKGHTHSGGILPTILGVLHFALIAGDEALVTWCKRAYEHARTFTSSFGWIPDGLGFDVRENRFAGTCETCSLADLLEIAITLTEAYVGDYWDDIDRFSRNQLLEQQLRDVNQALPSNGNAESNPTIEAITRGAFDSAAFPNSLIGDLHGVVEGCCTPAGARACQMVWDRIVTESVDGLHVNLSYSRDTPWARVISYEPYRGELRIEMRQARPLFVRVPSWANRSELHLTVDDTEQTPIWQGDRLALGTLVPGQTIVVTYPQTESDVADTIAGQDYLTHWRGGTVTSITPTGSRYPTYQRGNLDTSDVPMIDRIESVAPVIVRW